MVLKGMIRKSAYNLSRWCASASTCHFTYSACEDSSPFSARFLHERIGAMSADIVETVNQAVAIAHNDDIEACYAVPKIVSRARHS